MIAIVDYGVGNLFSLSSSLRYLGLDCKVTSKAEDLKAADRIIFPGVGAFADAIKKLYEADLAEPMRAAAASGKPVMGICLGMQLLCEKSYEYGEHEGLGLLTGYMDDLRGDVPADFKVPHMGWNALRFTEAGKKHPLFKYTKEGDYVYFVHSFYGKDCGEALLATADYGVPVTASLAVGNVMGCQFHPEKSGKVGLGILKAFSEI